MMVLRRLMIFLAGALCLLGFESVVEVSGISSWGNASSNISDNVSDKVVVITQADVRKIQQELAEKIGSDPTPLQIKSAIDHTIENEILVNEALLMGLHNIDSVVRQRILLNMIFVGGEDSEEALFDNAKSLGMFRHDIVVRRRLIERMKKIIVTKVANTASKDELLQYYQALKEKNDTGYQRGKTVRLIHGYFTASNYSVDQVDDLYRQWINGELSDNQMQRLADSVLVNSAAYITVDATKKLLGDGISVLITDVKRDADNNGFLPLQKNSVGSHFIRVISVLPSQYRPYDEIEAQLRSDYIDEKRSGVLMSTLAQLRAEYDVIQ